MGAAGCACRKRHQDLVQRRRTKGQSSGMGKRGKAEGLMALHEKKIRGCLFNEEEYTPSKDGHPGVPAEFCSPFLKGAVDNYVFPEPRTSTEHLHPTETLLN